VATIKSPLMRRGAQHALGNLIADAFQNVLRTDLALMDNAGIHSDLQAGVVAWRHLFEMLPRQSTLVSLRLSGADILQVLESTLADGTSTAHISGATVKFDPTRPSGRRVREIRLANGRKLKDKERYSIAVPEYLVGDPAWGIPESADCIIFGSAFPVYETMTTSVRVFVNERPLEVPLGATARDAVRAADEDLERRLDDGSAYLTDGRGIRLLPEIPLTAGSILRVVVTARHQSEDVDAHS
jgi:2',3'-cyclic-nucleotide 2'-phosphodiesterase (5'-nucleotidase family)